MQDGKGAGGKKDGTSTSNTYSAGTQSDKTSLEWPYKDDCTHLYKMTKQNQIPWIPDCSSCCQFLPDLHFLSALKPPAFTIFTQTAPEAQGRHKG